MSGCASSEDPLQPSTMDKIAAALQGFGQGVRGTPQQQQQRQQEEAQQEIKRQNQQIIENQRRMEDQARRDKLLNLPIN